MIEVLSTNITSPLGYTTEQNYQALKAGGSALSSYDSWRNIPENFAASMFNGSQVEELKIPGYTLFESMTIRSVEEALSHTCIDASSPRTVFILSTTKANVDELAAEEAHDGDYLNPGDTARKIADRFGMKSVPIVVCNACISGVTAQMLAGRLIDAGHYDNAIVCGADCLSPFVVSGFLSFKSLSSEPCRPFDIERSGLNIGEAAATMIFGKAGKSPDGKWRLIDGALSNDAYHLSAPSPSGEGTLQVIASTLEGVDTERLGMINVHGTATMFNDQMESKAIERASLSHIPLSALKGYYGHTLGASGVLETVISMRSLDDGYILPVRGYSEIGVSGRINISGCGHETDKKSFMKIISGFGGCNGALLFSKDMMSKAAYAEGSRPVVSHSLHLTQSGLTIDGKGVDVSSTGKELLTELYRKHIGDYPKFHKMDVFTKLVFIASDLLAGLEDDDVAKEDRAIVFFNRSSSVVADRKHISTVFNEEGFFPSPSLFLYTLPNIVTGEIAIRNGYKGETSLYILENRNDEIISQVVESSFAHSAVRSMMTGWVDCSDEDTFEADIRILTK